ncbi:MAG: GyrI-like domain-containing protein [Phycisphaerae bacterium]
MSYFIMANRRHPLSAGAGLAACSLLACSTALLADEKPGATPARPDAQNLYAQHQSEYQAPESPTLVDVGEARYLSISGKGEPDGEAFRRKVGVLYRVAYAVKMRNKFAGRDYSMMPLEGVWWGSKQDQSFLDEPREEWNWKLLIRVPESITEDSVRAATGAIADQGGETAVKEVGIETLNEGRCVQVLHVGPYDQEAGTMAAMKEFATSEGLTFNGPHHEIYLSNPNTTEPAKLRTILRQPVKAK